MATATYEALELPAPTFAQDGVYTPISDGEHDGVVTGHAVQTIRADAESL